MSIKVSVTGVEKEFRKLDYAAKKAIKDKGAVVLKKIGKPVLGALKANTPVFHKPMRRFTNDGTLRAVYEPGNLRKSMSMFPSTSNVYPSVELGPATSARAGGGFLATKLLEDDGWYAFFIINGEAHVPKNDFVKRTERQVKTKVKKQMEYHLIPIIEDEIQKNLDKKI